MQHRIAISAAKEQWNNNTSAKWPANQAKAKAKTGPKPNQTEPSQARIETNRPTS